MTLYGRRTTIGDLINEVGGEVKTGPFGTALKASEYTTTGVPVISVGEIGHGEFHIHDRTPYVDESVTTRLPQFLLEIGDIVFARKGSVERSALVGHRQQGWFLGSDGIRLRLSDAVDSRFVRYWISSEETKHWLVQNSTGSTMASLNQATVKRLPIVLPSLAEQREIASILGALDDKIELNHRMSATLEDMARSLYRSWFVDFDPVHAKMEGRQPAFMDEATAALFPDRFGDDGLPEGWTTSSLGDLSKISSGKRPPNKSTMPDTRNQTPVYGGNGISWYTRNALFDERFLITGRVGTLGTVFRVSEPCWVSDNALCVFPISIQLLEFLFFAISDLDFASLNSGSTQPLLTQTSLKKQPVAHPPDAIISEFHTLVGDWFRKVHLLHKENQILANLRDSLLPKLMSGELRVGEAREQVEEVA